MEKLKEKLGYFFKAHRKQVLFYLFLNSCFALCISLASYVHITLSGFKDYSAYTVHFFIMQFSVAGFIYFITLNKWGFRFIFLPSFFFLSLFSYWVYTHDISVTTSLIQASLESKPSIVLDLLSVQYLLFILAIVLILFFLNRIYNKFSPIRLNFTFFMVASFCVFSFFLMEKKRPNSLKSRLPFSVFYGLKYYVEKEPYRLKEVPNDVYDSAKKIKIVLVLGESVRADHLQLNNYHRSTTPLLSNNKNIVSFNNINSVYTSTAGSLPRMITNASVNNRELNCVMSLFDIFNTCNYNTNWFGNQELEKSYDAIVKTNKNVILIDSLRSVMSLKKVVDDKLLAPFTESFFQSEKGLYTMHMMGSHWWYENRYTDDFRKFKPVINSKYIPSLTSDQLINSYDNTILYLDYFLNEVITIQERLKEPTLLIYMSDHGESLGEGGMWLHAQESDVAKNPAMIVWYSDEFKEAFPSKVLALNNNKSKDLTTDTLFSSLMDLIAVKNLKYNPKESIFFNEINAQN